MTVLIVSANPLFREVLRESLALHRSDLVDLSPDEALGQIDEAQPAVILLDEQMPEATLQALLAKVRSLYRSRAILVNPSQNEIVLLDCNRSTVQHMEDMLEAISALEPH